MRLRLRPLLALVVGGVLLIQPPALGSSELRYRYFANGAIYNGPWALIEQEGTKATGETWEFDAVTFEPIGVEFSLKVTEDPIAAAMTVPVYVGLLDAGGKTTEGWVLCLRNGQVQGIPVDPGVERAKVQILNSGGNLYGCRLLGTASTGILTIRR